MATNKEKVKSANFEKKFKNTLRDYYTYGFTNKELAITRQNQGKTTIADDWTRLNDLLQNYFEWSQNASKVMYASVDSRELDINPFHEIYRYCIDSKSDAAYFFNMLAALSPKIKLRGTGGDRYIEDNKIYFENEDNPTNDSEDRLHACLARINSENALKTSDIMYFYSAGLELGRGNNTQHNNKLSNLEHCDLISCVRNQKGGDRRWKINNKTLGVLIEEGKKINPDFEMHLKDFLEFYSRSFLMGELGVFLKDRLNSSEYFPLKINHEYFMQSLNDFTLCDLLYAIDHKKWCFIEYTHGMSDLSIKLFCYPLGIFVSTQTGREYLIYYEPYKQQWSNLRLEFIDKIDYIKSSKLPDLLKDCKNVEKNIKISYKDINAAWGTSAPRSYLEKGEVDAPSSRVSLKFKNDSKIIDRLLKEGRNGEIIIYEDCVEYKVDVFNPVELRPWVRSFYSDLIEIDGMDSNFGASSFSIPMDIRNMLASFEEKQKSHVQQKSNKAPGGSPSWGVPDEILPQFEKARESATQHDKLFNKYFSLDFYIIGEAFTRYAQAESILNENQIKSIVKKAISRYSQSKYPMDYNAIKELLMYDLALKNSDMQVGEYQSKYICDKNFDFYRDVVALNKIELQWLLSVIDDKRAGYFFNEEEIKVIRDFVGDSIHPLAMDKVYYIDRFKRSEEMNFDEGRNWKLLMDGNRHHTMVSFEYAENLEQNYKPIELEFSKYEDCFSCYFENTEGRIIKLPLDSLKNLKNQKEKFDKASVRENLKSYKEKQRKEIRIKIDNTGGRNTVDRILTELSPWEKQCSLDDGESCYKLALYYQEDEQEEMIRRLLSYAIDLEFEDKMHPIAMAIKSRLEIQKTLLN